MANCQLLIAQKDTWQQQQRSPRRRRNRSSPPSTAIAAASADGHALFCASSASAACASAVSRLRVRFLGYRSRVGREKKLLALSLWPLACMSTGKNIVELSKHKELDRGAQESKPELMANSQWLVCSTSRQVLRRSRSKRVTIRGDKRR